MCTWWSPHPQTLPRFHPVCFQTQQGKHRCFWGALGRAAAYSKVPGWGVSCAHPAHRGWCTLGPSPTLSREVDAATGSQPPQAGSALGRALVYPRTLLVCTYLAEPQRCRLAGDEMMSMLSAVRTEEL